MIEKIFRKQTRRTDSPCESKKSQSFLNRTVKQLYDIRNEGIFSYKSKTQHNGLKAIVNQLCNLHKEERMKGTNAISFLKQMEQFFIKNDQNPEDVINWCLDNQINPIIQSILADCYFCGKWINKDNQKTFEFDQKSAEGGYIIAYSCLGFCYGNGRRQERTREFKRVQENKK
ncbi:9358_t:CDS:2 [Cetraspora pellucida]|uniref:9358_t:CDS:1 n=1 Tax=Cetraspora pellucida TaxID=1433469 RepID=A0A9N9EM76_9GLOM|nr:9358_t:CDS:2 [Cetraspora pellucida]